MADKSAEFFKIAGKKANDARALLDQKIKACDALNMNKKTCFRAVIFVNDEGNNDNYEVELNFEVAEACLKQQIARIDTDLAKLGLVVEGEIP